jgi:hypothetical protein
MIINQQTKDTISNLMISAAYHFSKGDLNSLNFCKQLLGESVIALEKHLAGMEETPDSKEPEPLDMPPQSS